MSDIENVRQYFTRSALRFDSLYDEESSALVRFINHQFRRDIYERLLLSLDHVRKFNLMRFRNNSAFDSVSGTIDFA